MDVGGGDGVHSEGGCGFDEQGWEVLWEHVSFWQRGRKFVLRDDD
jgi:hypothetical protein